MEIDIINKIVLEGLPKTCEGCYFEWQIGSFDHWCSLLQKNVIDVNPICKIEDFTRYIMENY